jgi:hypothetical protein
MSFIRKKYTLKYEGLFAALRHSRSGLSCSPATTFAAAGKTLVGQG